MKDRSPVVICWIFSILAITFLLLGIRCYAQTNAIGIFDGNGKLVATVGVGAQLITFLAGLAGLGTAARLLLRFLPKAQPGTFNAYLVAALKFLGTVTQEKHQDDTKTQAPTDNGLTPPAKPPTTNIQP